MPKGASFEQDKQKSDLVLYREVDMSDFSSQYPEDMETFRQILNLPDLRAVCLCPLPQSGL